jgi:hypothetical protein
MIFIKFNLFIATVVISRDRTEVDRRQQRHELKNNESHNQGLFA